MRETAIWQVWKRPVRGYVILVLSFTLGLLALNYIGRLTIIESQREGCFRGQTDRHDYIKQDEASIKGNEAIVADPRQPPRTKAARKEQAEVEMVVIADLKTRVMPALNCRTKIKDPGLI